MQVIRHEAVRNTIISAKLVVQSAPDRREDGGMKGAKRPGISLPEQSPD